MQTNLQEISLPNSNTLLVKRECDNPLGENHYGRIYKEIIKDLEVKGKIKPRQRLYDFTSGSAGIAMAVTCKKMGYQAVVAMPAGGEKAREEAILKQGAELHLTDAEKYVEGAATFNQRFLAKNRDCYFLCHAMSFDKNRKPIPNETALKAVGKAMEEVHDSHRGDIDYFIAVSGNGITQHGFGRMLKSFYPNIKIYGHEALESSFMFDKVHPGKIERELGLKDEDFSSFSRHKLPGTSYRVTWPTPSLEAAIPLTYEQLLVYDQKAHSEYEKITGNKFPDKNFLVKWDRDGTPAELNDCGRTTHSSYWIARDLAKNQRNKTFLIVAYDKANRYDG